jgi:hypothetical protein
MVGYTRFDRGSHAQGLVDSAKVEANLSHAFNKLSKCPKKLKASFWLALSN